MTTELRCPSCNRFLGEVTGYARLVCPTCGSETTYRSRDQRRKEGLAPPRIERAVTIATGMST